MTSRILRFPEVRSRIGGYSRMHVDRLEKAGNFPKRIQIGGNAVGWDESEIEDWIKSRKDARHQPSVVSLDSDANNSPAAPASQSPRKRGRPPGVAHHPAP
ncbi:AlpA family transcriptional regulator [Azospirillum cavernae]|uniref:AlpA family transcriptional regulator n=1 Tax=Azospirillum cavernae TaxID=2320860 RepID=A0A418VX12_9PROT|nr:AlpA family transcriptional regulator [Azospirillum cavernae]RJF81682.1 AlpA family transcriptional regulator [Azospirillum cavernae]